MQLTNLKLLYSARVETHATVQLIAMVPRCLLEPDASDSSASLIWDNNLKMLTSQDVHGFKLAYEFISQKVYFYDGAEAIKSIETIRLTVDQVFESIRSCLNDLGFQGDKLSKELPYELPESVTRSGFPFIEQDKDALSTLTELYAITQKLLNEVFEDTPSASEIRCWPHHYDLATLVTIEEHEDSEKVKSIGFGLSPGDAGYDEPYFYITPWPYPAEEYLYSLDSPAFWNTEGWTGGVLRVNDIKSTNIEAVVRDFFKIGYNNLKGIL